MRVQGAGPTAMEWPHRWSVQGKAGCTSRVRRSWPNPDEMHDKTKEGKVWGKARRDQVPCSRHTLCIDGLCERPWLHEPGLRARAHPVAQRHMAHVRLGWDDVRECGERQGHGKATGVKLAELRRGSAKRPDASSSRCTNTCAGQPAIALSRLPRQPRWPACPLDCVCPWPCS